MSNPRGKEIAEVSARLAAAASTAMDVYGVVNIMAVNPKEPMLLIATRDPVGVELLAKFIQENLSAENVTGYRMEVDQDGNVTEQGSAPPLDNPFRGPKKDSGDVN